MTIMTFPSGSEKKRFQFAVDRGESRRRFGERQKRFELERKRTANSPIK
jgi:hypothetical protein